LAKDLYIQERNRRESLDKKVSWLLTLSGILIPLSVKLIITSSSQLPRWFHFPALLLVTGSLLLTAVLLLEYLAVGTFSQPIVDEPLLKANESERKCIVLNSYIDATRVNQDTNHYLVDLYRAARRMFSAALTAVALLGLVAAALLTWGSTSQLEDRLIQKLRSEPKLIDLLRGPVGPVGPQGPRGQRGEVGPRGERGEGVEADPS
jgi:hypothetical protein